MTFSNSRTFPGQSQARNADIVAGGEITVIVADEARARAFRRSARRARESSPLAQRRQCDGKDVQAVIEVLRNLPASTSAQIAVRGGDERTSTRRGVRAPSRSNSRSWSTRSSFACSAAGSSPISSRKSVPPSAARSARGGARRAGEGAALVAEELGLEQASGSAAQFTSTNGPVARGARRWMRARDQFLAGAGLAHDQHGGVRAGAPPTRASTACMPALSATTPSKLVRSPSRARRSSFSACSRSRKR